MVKALRLTKKLVFSLSLLFLYQRSTAQYAITTDKEQFYLYDSSEVIVAPHLVLSTDDVTTPSISNARVKITSGYVKGDTLLFNQGTYLPH
ncbi:MAG: hypothetical protein DI598_13640 [Pseudopedobacter saltans]|uniref:LPS-assembly protein LptD n=1 Tax=Pseudopedobacter saltans TaxID=151895 RepID=A0A2W5EPL8_9SPHI|nr:MAG: hypothetical protein DI598_13640 [Pseudopedobacter saltans]